MNPARCHAGKNFQIRVVNKQGLDAWSGSSPPTKTLPFHGDMTKGRLCHVPAISTPVFAAFQFVEPGDRLSQEPEHVITLEYFELILKLSDMYQLRNPQGDDYIILLISYYGVSYLLTQSSVCVGRSLNDL